MNNYYNLYVESVYSLAETISIKFEDAAHALNLGVILKHGIDSVSTDPFSWKYYQNISGAYHFSDTKMLVVSLDTLQEIEFNLTNLSNHPATKEAYQFGKRHYRELVQRYPDQESIILGILYPSDITIAVESKDGTILNYPKKLVDSNEYTFIEKLQKWVYNYVDRWINKQYTISDDLYTATYLGQLYLHLIPAIINIRLQACKTNEAHSFHIQQYLASHGMLDRYIEAMTKEQCLFFYRNILYIERNSGKRDTFNWLVDNLMTKRSLPLYEYTMKHDVSKMLPSIQNGNSTNYYPEITFRKNPINFINNEATKEFLSLTQVKNKLNHTTSGNLEYQKEHSDNIRETLEDSKSNVVATKLLESSLVDYSQSSPELFADVLLHHWAYWCSLNKYNAYISITLPKSKKVLELSVKNVFILLVYTLNRSVGINLSKIPDILILNVLQDPVPNINVLRNCTQKKYVSDELITQLYNTVPNITSVGTVDLFYNQCKLVYNAIQTQHLIQSSGEHITTCGELKMASAKLYVDVKIKLHPTELEYSTWLDNLGINFFDYNDSEFNEFSLTLVSQATGLINNKSVSVKQIQKAMIEMLALLSSYSIQIISDVSQPNINLVNGTSVRVGDIVQSESTNTFLDENRFDILDSTGRESNDTFLDLDIIYPITVTNDKESTKNHLEIGINIYEVESVVDLKPVKVRIPNFTVLDVITFIPNPDPGGEFRTNRITNIPVYLNTVNHSFYTDAVAEVSFSLSGNYNSFYTNNIFQIPVYLNTSSNVFYTDNITNIPFNIISSNSTFFGKEFLTSNITDPFANNIVLLLNGEGSNGSTTFIDSSNNPKTITPYGGSTISTVFKRFGNSSMHFDGVNGSRLDITPTNDFAFGTNDFTVDGIFFTEDFNQDGEVWSISSYGTGPGYFGYFGVTNNNVTIGMGGLNPYATIGPKIILQRSDVINKSIHVAWQISNHIATVWIDGILAASMAMNVNITLPDRVRIGGMNDYRGGPDGFSTTNYCYHGYIDKLRITSSARYTSNFIPDGTPIQTSVIVPISLNGATPYVKTTQIIPLNISNGKNVLISPTAIDLPLNVNQGNNILGSTAVNNLSLNLSNGKNSLYSPNINTLTFGFKGQDIVETLEYFTSVLYPLIVEDNLTINTAVPTNSSRFLEQLKDNLVLGSSVPTAGTLIETIVYKTVPLNNYNNDAITIGSSVPVIGTIEETIVYKTVPLNSYNNDSITIGNSVPIDGTLNVTISYISKDINGDNFSINSSIPISGTLT